MHLPRSIHHSWVFVAVAFLLVLGSGSLGLAQAIPNQPAHAIQRKPTPTERPSIIDRPIEGLLPTAVPSRPPRVTPTPTSPTPPRVRPTPTLPPLDPRPTVAVQPTVPQPPLQPQPDLPNDDDTLPGDMPPLTVEPWIPGQHNRFEITLHTCPAGIDLGGNEAAFLAACPRSIQNPPPDNIHFQMRDGDQTHVQSDSDDDGVFVFDDITIIPGPRFFIAEEFNPGYGDPAVFCGEGGNAHTHMPAPYRVIRPDLSTFSNVTYTCTWFKIPLQGDTVRVHSHTCIRKPEANAPFNWFWQNCRYQAPYDGTAFALTDANGTTETPTTAGEVTWSNVEFGPDGTVTIERTASSDSFPYRVFCGDFNSGSEKTVTNDTVTVSRSSDPSPVEHICRWYRYPSGSAFGEGIQIPNMLTVEVWTCPQGQDPAAGHDLLQDACIEPAVGSHVAMTYPQGMLAILTSSSATPSVAEFGLIGEGYAAVVAEVPAGHTGVVFCQLQGQKGWASRQVTTVTIQFSWDQRHRCAWFLIPGAGAGGPQSTYGFGPIWHDYVMKFGNFTDGSARGQVHTEGIGIVVTQAGARFRQRAGHRRPTRQGCLDRAAASSLSAPPKGIGVARISPRPRPARTGFPGQDSPWSLPHFDHYLLSGSNPTGSINHGEGGHTPRVRPRRARPTTPVIPRAPLCKTGRHIPPPIDPLRAPHPSGTWSSRRGMCRPGRWARASSDHPHLPMPSSQTCDVIPSAVEGPREALGCHSEARGSVAAFTVRESLRNAFA